MQKTWNIVSVVAIVGLGIWVVLLLMANSKWKALLTNPVLPPASTTPNTAPDSQTNSATDTTASTTPDSTPASTEVHGKPITGAELWNQLKEGAKEIKLDLTF